MKPIRKVWNVVLAMSRPVLFGIIAGLAVVALMTFRLGTLVPGVSAPEIAAYESANALNDLVNNPVNLPYKTVVFLTTTAVNNIYGLRIVSALLDTLTVGIFYLLARKLYSPWIAFAVTALFATSSFLLHVSRLGTPDIMLAALLALVGVGYLLRFSNKPDLAWPLAAGVVSLSLYVPGMVLFILPAAIWQFWQVRKSFEQLKSVTITICAFIIGFLLAPMVISLIRDPNLWRQYLGLPTEFATISEMAKNAGRALASLFAISSFTPAYWLGRTPVLDVFATVLFLYGAFSLLARFRLDRLWMFLGIYTIGLAWIGVTGYQPAVFMLLPITYLIVGFGVFHMIRQWVKVFPNNPIARSTGVAMMAVALSLAINFQVQRYFIAWPNNSDTKAAFNLTLPK